MFTKCDKSQLAFLIVIKCMQLGDNIVNYEGHIYMVLLIPNCEARVSSIHIFK